MFCIRTLHIKRPLALLIIAAAAVCLFAVQPVHAATESYTPKYTVLQGDYLYRIGTLFGTTHTNLMQLNGLKSTMIYPGQKLAVPAATHTVKTGDTLYLISLKYKVSLESLRRANNIRTDMIYPGQVLLLPGNAVSSSGSYVVPCTTAEYDLLARLVTAEAASESYQAQVAVAAVVINRVQSKEWPNTISSVIYQVANGYYQFTPVENGYINKPATELSKSAAREALYGKDPTNGAIFYFDDSATNKWLWSRPTSIVIGHMVYKF